jgi:PAS domain S-box-containing protein
VSIAWKFGQDGGLFRALVENSSDGVFLIDRTGTISDASPSTIRLLGYRADQLEGRSFLDIVHPEDYELVRECYIAALRYPARPVPASAACAAG